jgi:hypothetical protein
MDPAKVLLDHNHNTGAFLAWCCSSCNRRITDRIGDFGEGSELSMKPSNVWQRRYIAQHPNYKRDWRASRKAI